MEDSPAGRYLQEHAVSEEAFNSYGSRRGNHEVMMRGTFANIRLRNRMTPDIEGGVTKFLPTGEVMSIFDAARLYAEQETPLIVIAGKEYGTGPVGTGRPREPCCWGLRPCWRKVTSGFTGPIWSAWASCPCSSLLG